MRYPRLRTLLLSVLWLLLDVGSPRPAAAQFVRSPEFPTSLQRSALQSTVRIIARKPDGMTSGSGVVVGRDTGSFLIATAKHVLSDALSAEVQTFDGSYPAPTRSYHRVRTVVQDESLDFALARVDGHFGGEPLPLCPPGRIPSAGEHVLSVGCGGGNPPTCEVDRLLGRDRTYWAVAQAGAKGRSGGPLVSEDGYVIGCCCCGDGKTTFYSYIDGIHQALDTVGLARLYSPRNRPPVVAARTPQPPARRSTTSGGPVVRVSSRRTPAGIPFDPSNIGSGTRRIEISSSSGQIVISTSSQEIEIGPAGIVIRKGGVIQRVER
jgi:hypothetical protein